MVSAPWGCVCPKKEFFKSTWKKYPMQHMPKDLLFGRKKTGSLRYLQQAEAISDQERKIILKPMTPKSSELEIFLEALCKCVAPHEEMERYHPTKRPFSSPEQVWIPGLPLSKQKCAKVSSLILHLYILCFHTQRALPTCTYVLSKP